ncbi:MAG: hypothetical protein ACE5K9_10230 [Candidatus Methylomirabilales bacterium]
MTSENKRECPECGSEKVHFIGRPEGGVAEQIEATSSVFMCEVCGAQFPDPQAAA